MIDRGHQLPLSRRRLEILGISRGSLYLRSLSRFQRLICRSCGGSMSCTSISSVRGQPDVPRDLLRGEGIAIGREAES